jgi:hypothetical protein
LYVCSINVKINEKVVAACNQTFIKKYIQLDEPFPPPLRKLNESLENEKAVHLYVGYLYVGQDHSKANLIWRSWPFNQA